MLETKHKPMLEKDHSWILVDLGLHALDRDWRRIACCSYSLAVNWLSLAVNWLSLAVSWLSLAVNWLSLAVTWLNILHCDVLLGLLNFRDCCVERMVVEGTASAVSTAIHNAYAKANDPKTQECFECVIDSFKIFQALRRVDRMRIINVRSCHPRKFGELKATRDTYPIARTNVR